MNDEGSPATTGQIPPEPNPEISMTGNSSLMDAGKTSPDNTRINFGTFITVEDHLYALLVAERTLSQLECAAQPSPDRQAGPGPQGQTYRYWRWFRTRVCKRLAAFLQTKKNIMLSRGTLLNTLLAQELERHVSEAVLREARRVGRPLTSDGLRASEEGARSGGGEPVRSRRGRRSGTGARGRKQACDFCHQMKTKRELLFGTSVTLCRDCFAFCFAEIQRKCPPSHEVTIQDIQGVLAALLPDTKVSDRQKYALIFYHLYGMRSADMRWT
ncbi:hypothetical protein ACSFCX_01010 [Yokenella regensburgei]|uniref:hypothetical protein n=1 Tax=Yokenella regensburgei TaxID=158877 RepID=UPI00289A1F08|nr:hypothetical protein [Yokenella regensburgei]